MSTRAAELSARLGVADVEDLIDALLESVGDGIYVVDPGGRVLYANAAALALLGYDEERELLGRPSHATIHHTRPDGSPFPIEECPLLRPYSTGEVVRVEEDAFVRRDGAMVAVAYSSAPLPLAAGRGAVVVFHDVSQRLQQEQLRRERERAAGLRASRARVVAAADAERRRLARDLHDGAQQRLVTAAMHLDVALAGGGDAELTIAREQLRVAVEDLRRLARGLHPAVLEHRGLQAAVSSLTAASPVPASIEIPDERYPAPLETGLYFFIAEAVANAVKHAGASAIDIRVKAGPDSLVAEVRDDGRGGARIADDGGLAGLHDRIAALDGTLSLESPAGGGTTVRATVKMGEFPQPG